MRYFAFGLGGLSRFLKVAFFRAQFIGDDFIADPNTFVTDMDIRAMNQLGDLPLLFPAERAAQRIYGFRSHVSIW